MWADVSQFVCKHHPDVLSVSRFLQLTAASQACFPDSHWRANAIGVGSCRDREVLLCRIHGTSGDES